MQQHAYKDRNIAVRGGQDVDAEDGCGVYRTFALVFIGCGVVITQSALGGIKATALVKGVAMEVNPSSYVAIYVAIAFAFGLTVMTMIYAVGHISAAHFNPAVTIGFAIAGRFPWRYVPHYLFAEFGGAFLASLVHWALMSGEGTNVNFGATSIPPTFNLLGGFLVEIVLTFLLMFVIMAVATYVGLLLLVAVTCLAYEGANDIIAALMFGELHFTTRLPLISTL